MGTTVDVQLVILIIPLETSPSLPDGVVVLSVGLNIKWVSEGLSSRSSVCLFYLNQQLLVDLPGDVSPGLHPLPVLSWSPGGVGVHPFT